jgi:hypothetical protein
LIGIDREPVFHIVAAGLFGVTGSLIGKTAGRLGSVG